MTSTVLFVSNWDWVLFNFRLPLAQSLKDRGLKVVLVCPQGDYTEKFETNGFEWQNWKLNRRSTNPWRELGAIIDLVGIYRKRKPLAVHHFTIKPIVYGSLAAKITGSKIVINNFTGLGYLFGDSKKI